MYWYHDYFYDDTFSDFSTISDSVSRWFQVYHREINGMKKKINSTEVSLLFLLTLKLTESIDIFVCFITNTIFNLTELKLFINLHSFVSITLRLTDNYSVRYLLFFVSTFTVLHLYRKMWSRFFLFRKNDVTGQWRRIKPLLLRFLTFRTFFSPRNPSKKRLPPGSATRYAYEPV